MNTITIQKIEKSFVSNLFAKPTQTVNETWYQVCIDGEKHSEFKNEIEALIQVECLKNQKDYGF